MTGDDYGELKNNSTFIRRIPIINGYYNRQFLSHNLFSLYEGKTISYFVKKPKDDNLL